MRRISVSFSIRFDFLFSYFSRENLIQLEQKPLVLKEEVIKANALVRWLSVTCYVGVSLQLGSLKGLCHDIWSYFKCLKDVFKSMET